MDRYRALALANLNRFLLLVCILSIIFFIWSLLVSGKAITIPFIGKKIQGYYLIIKSQSAGSTDQRNRLNAIGRALINNETTYEYESPNITPVK
jgi:hypothetical protein